MSRLIIKNLPKTITETKLKNLFSQKGDITDIQLKYTPDGKFRQFGFIGYRTEEQAREALNYFNNTCIGTHRITVEICASLGDTANKPKAWSKYAPENKLKNNASDEKEVELETEKRGAEVKSHFSEGESIKKIIDEHKSDPLFEEYLSSNLKKGAIWSNDDVLNVESQNIQNKDSIENENSESESEDQEKESEKLANATISDLEYMKSLMITKPRQKTEKKPKSKIELFTIKIRGLPYKCKKKILKDFLKPLVPYSIRIPRKLKGFAYVGFKLEKDFNKALLKDRSFISGKRISVVKYVKKEDSNNNGTKFKNVPWKDKEELLKNEEDIATSGKIFIRNLAYTTTEDDIQKLFEKYGPLTECILPVDKTTRQIKGFGTVTFMFPEHAAKAYCELDGSVQSGRMLHLLPVKTNDDEKEIDNEGTNYKKQKELKQKNQALSSHNWNSLFVASDAVANAVAESYRTTKENVLGAGETDKKGTSAAVRLALGETQIVQDIKKYLESHDIYLDAFNSPNVKRSKTTLLVKNLPAGTTSDEIKNLFKPYGPISRLILPPNGITGVIEYYDSTEAKTAFKNLAYTKFKHTPLYLEWAPENVFKTSPPEKNEKTEKSKVDNKIETSVKMKLNYEKNQTVVLDTQKEENNQIENSEDAEEVPEPNTVLFVKNLNFATRDEYLRKHFEKCGKLSYATVAMKNDSKNPGNKLSMGYGFVRYMYESDTENALKVLQFSELDGKSLELKRSSRTTQEEIHIKRKTNLTKQRGTKILVKNIPFQANKHEVRDLFAPFGEIKALRLPQKLTGESHRGFAFVDYHTKNDAKQAFEALSQSTHLYGRRLVLEWAAADTEDIDELRKRTADQMQGPQKRPSFKKSLLDMEEK